MKKKYTKKQIVEAIAHWKNKLKKMDESTYSDKKLIATTEENIEYLQNAIDDIGGMYAFDDPRDVLERFNDFMQKEKEDFYNKWHEGPKPANWRN